MARPKNKPPIHQMARRISKQNMSNPDAGLWTVAQADEHVSVWLNDGYELLSAFSVQNDPDAYTVFYVLVLKDE